MVVRVHGDMIRQNVLGRQREVLDDKIDLLVGVLDARDGDVTQLVDEGREDLLTDVSPELGLEREVAVAVKEQVFRKLGEVVADTAMYISIWSTCARMIKRTAC